jgi:class 3 adenylate cyclase/ketosteroid isomerase-like protein
MPHITAPVMGGWSTIPSRPFHGERRFMFRRSFELERVLQRLLDAIDTKDLASLRTLLAQDPETLYIGTAEEWLHGVEGVEVFVAQVSAVPDRATTAWQNIEAYENGSTGWAASQSRFTLSDGVTRDSRVTAVFHLRDGVWKVVQWHASRPTTTLESFGVDLPVSLSQLIDSLDDGFEKIVAAQFKSSTVTLVITDIEGSTDRGVEMGDVLWTDAVDRHFTELANIAAGYDGTVVKTMGDGALIAFDSAVGGTRAALDIQRIVNEDEMSDGFQVRIGVHTGDAISKASDYFGYTVNKTARLAAAAKGGQTLVSDAARILIGDDSQLRFDEPLTFTLRGLPGTHIAYPLMAEPPGGRGRT